MGKMDEGAHLQLRLRLEQWTSKLAREVVAPHVPLGYGFTFIGFDLGEGGSIAYCSSAERDGMKQALRELLGKWDQEDGIEPTSPGPDLTAEELELVMKWIWEADPHSDGDAQDSAHAKLEAWGKRAGLR